MARMVCVSFVWPVLSTAVYNLLQTNDAPNALRTSTAIPQYMTKFAMDQVCDRSGLIVVITV